MRHRRRFAEAEVAYQHVRTMTDQRAITVWVAELQARAGCAQGAGAKGNAEQVPRAPRTPALGGLQRCKSSR